MKWIVGVDEVGRGPLAGPVYVCALAMPIAIYKKMKWKKGSVPLTDSKRMTASARVLWNAQADALIAEGTLRTAIISRSATHIDSKGIAVCIRDAVIAALQKLKLPPNDCLVLLDGGLKAPKEYIHQQTVIKGDQKHKIISLASVVAKVARDKMMVQNHRKYPLYMWHENKGYGTRVHTRAITANGISPLHRKSFLKKYLTK